MQSSTAASGQGSSLTAFLVNKTGAAVCFINAGGQELIPSAARKFIRQRAAVFGAKDRSRRRQAPKPRKKRTQAIELVAVPCLDSFRPYTAYEGARTRFKADIMQIAVISGFSIGADADQLRSWQRPGAPARSCQWSYLDFIPSRYGYSECLSSATDCVLEQIACMSGEHAPGKGPQLYTRALSDLRGALDDADECRQSETLCAVHLLGVYEFLNPTCTSSWLNHIQGAARLLQHRTSARATSTDFDKALLAAHIGPALYQSFAQVADCYLAQPCWIEACRNLGVVDVPLSHRSSIIMDMQLCAVEMPGLWKSVHAAMISPAFDVSSVLQRLRRSHQAHQDVLHRLEQYRASTEVRPENQATQDELYRYVLEGNIVNSRLLAAVDHESYRWLSAQVRAMLHEYAMLQPQGSRYTWLASQHEELVRRGFAMDRVLWTEVDERLPALAQRQALRRMYFGWCEAIRPDMPRLVVED